MADHTQYAKQLPGNTTPNVPREELPKPLGAALREFLLRIDQVRGKYGRDQLRHMSLAGWESCGEDLDRLDTLAGEYERDSLNVKVEGDKEEWVKLRDKNRKWEAENG